MEELNQTNNSKRYILDLDNNSNKEKIKKIKIPWNKKSMRCNFCGSQILLMNKARHEKTQKHKDGAYLTTDRFEMI
jgi:DNA-directed RNA polymerase subunit RPC12/RpoP